MLLLASLGGGGAESVMVTLAKHLDRTRFETHLAVASAKGPLRGEVPADVELHDLHASRVRYCVPSLLRLIWRLRPAVILSTSVHVNVPLLAIRALLPHGIKIFVRENNSPGESAIAGRRRKEKFLYHWFYGHANAVICQSYAMLQDLCEQFDVPREKLVCIYNPVDRERIRHLANSSPNPFAGPGPHLVAGGRLVRAKGFDILLNAMVDVHQSFPQAHLSILGSGALLQELRDRSARLGLNEAVTFAGYQKNPFPYYANADLFVLSSRYDALPNAMLEAMALRTPVVAIDCLGGVREILEGWPDCRLAKSEDVGALASAILAALQNKKELAEAPPDCRFHQTSLRYAVGRYENLLLS
jgi:glycosyltransferase involved in cell wall biosynthesis